MNDNTAAILGQLKALPAQTITTTIRSPRGASERSFKGALLLDYAVAAGLIPKITGVGGFGAYYFVVTADDGFKVAVSFFEAAERFSGKKVLLAYEQDGEPLRIGVRLVVPGDGLGGRSIMGVASIEIRKVESEPKGEREPSTGFDVTGLVERQTHFDASDLQRFALKEVETIAAKRRDNEDIPPRRYGGVLIFDLLEAAGIKVDPEVNEDILRRVIVVRSADGYGAVIAAGEIEPRFMDGGAIVATSSNGAALGEDDGRLRVVVPYDRSVARSLKSLAGIELREA